MAGASGAGPGHSSSQPINKLPPTPNNLPPTLDNLPPTHTNLLPASNNKVVILNNLPHTLNNQPPTPNNLPGTVRCNAIESTCAGENPDTAGIASEACYQELRSFAYDIGTMECDSSWTAKEAVTPECKATVCGRESLDVRSDCCPPKE